MANNYSVKVDADISNYKSNIDSAADATKKFQDAAEDANKAVEDIGKKGARSTKELLNEMQDLEKGGRSVSNYRRQLTRLQRDIADLTINYRAMSDEMKNTDLGRDTIIRISELKQEASNYKDAVLDAQQAITQLASDTFYWDVAARGINLASSALQTYISFGFNSADTTEKLSKVLGRLKMAEQGAAFAITALNELNEDTGRIMQLIGNIQLAAASKVAKMTKATDKQTIAMKALNLVSKANPYVLLASAIGALAIGLGTYIVVTKRSTSASQDATKAIKNLNEALEEGKEEANESIAKFMVLQSTWKSLKTEAEKTEWIKDNQDAFKDLELSINDVNDAEKAFVTYSPNIIKAMVLRAQAAKLQEQLVKEYEKALKKSEKIENDFGTRKDWEAAGLKAGEDFKTGYTRGSSTTGQGLQTFEYLTESGKEKMKAAAKKNAQNYLDEYDNAMKSGINQLNGLIDESKALVNPLGPIKDDSKETSDALKLVEGSLKAAEQKLTDMRDKFENMPPTDLGFDQMKKDVAAQEKLVERLKKKYETIKNSGEQVVAHNSRLSQLKDELTELNKIEPKLKEGTKEWDAHYKKVAEIEKEIKDLEGAIEAYKKRINSTPLELPVVVSDIKFPNKVEPIEVPIEIQRDKIVEEFQKAKDKVSRIKGWLEVGAITKQEAENLVAGINKELADKKIKAKVGLEVDDTEAISQIQSMVNDFDDFSNNAYGIVGSMNDIYESVSRLGDKLSEAESGWESFFAVFQTGMTIFQSFTTLLETFGTIMEFVDTLRGVGIATTEADTQATKRNTEEKLKNAGATAAGAIAEGTNSAAKIPMVGWAVALSAGASLLAMLLGAMKSVKGFSNGGIVGGNSFHGDNILARLNANEMVLNPKQQANLFKMLDSGKMNNTSGGQVEFKINGTQLVGVLNNINRKNSNI